ncbi:hypothetical protein C8J57DRAFT_1466103 [Mycena rebaudengoi]|nr:hypothetical protein C8J57DRAFT_1466103 [Mycena rebaudengoi]
MFSRNFIALASLILSSLVIRVDAGTLIPKAISGSRTGSFIPKIISNGKFEIKTIAPPGGISRIVTSAQTSIAAWVPTAANLIVTTGTVFQGELAKVGWIWEGIPDGSVLFDGFEKNITAFYTPPGGTEEVLWSTSVGPDTNLCGIFPGFGFSVALDSNDLGTYKARWIVEFGQSTQPDAPVDPNSGCGPEPFDSTTVDSFERYWEVVEAE